MSLEKMFHLKENNTTVKTEIMAGVTSFMTMAYILAVNPNILAAAGMDHGAVFTATAVASFIGTLCMALFANYPFALAPGMGLNAYFAYTVVLGMGYSWEVALAAVLTEGIIFIILSCFNIREAIFNAIPFNLKKAVSVGIGLFITFLGLQNAKIVIGGATLVGLFSVDGYNKTLADGLTASMSDAGITVLLAIFGVLITGILIVKNVKGNILWGILITWILGIICQFAGIYIPNPDLGFYNLLPDFSNGISIPSLAPIMFKFSLKGVPVLEFIIIVFAFLFVDLFDTLGTLIGVSAKADMLDSEGRLLRIKGALLADAVGTTCGACLGTSTVTTFVESASGVTEGGRTGLTSLTTGILVPIPDLPCNPVLCDGSGPDRCRLLHDRLRIGDRFQGSGRRNPGIPLHHRDAVLLQHLRGNLHGSYRLCCHEPLCRKEGEDHSCHVYPGGALHPQVYFNVNM